MPAQREEIRHFYDEVYYKNARDVVGVSRHLRRLALRFEPWKNLRILDVACGTGRWLMAVHALGAIPSGIDLSRVALDACQRTLPKVELHCGSAETLPFDNCQFDFISCLGALEHLIDPQAALREMVRCAKPDARFLLLVPNSGFLPRRLGLYAGTHQAQVHEEDRSLEEWHALFESAGLRVERRWRDLHVLSASWIFRGPWYLWFIRATQALALPLWPLSWQYQVYHLCGLKHR